MFLREATQRNIGRNRVLAEGGPCINTDNMIAHEQCCKQLLGA